MDESDNVCFLLIFRNVFIPNFITCSFFFFNDTPTTEIYTLSLHDALPISRCSRFRPRSSRSTCTRRCTCRTSSGCRRSDRKSTRLNSSHVKISYAVFCLKKKKKKNKIKTRYMITRKKKAEYL